MNTESNALSVGVAVIVMASWWVFALLFLLRKREAKAVAQKRKRSSLLGVALVGVGYGIVWTMRRPMFTPPFDCGPVVDWGSASAAILLCGCSIALILSAMRTLGRHWSVEARLLDGHQLVRSGAYAIVRHPIYSGMLGMMISTGLAYSIPVWGLAAVLVACYGTHLRIKSEEALLKEAFGGKYEEYSREVPALVPWLSWIR